MHTSQSQHKNGHCAQLKIMKTVGILQRTYQNELERETQIPDSRIKKPRQPKIFLEKKQERKKNNCNKASSVQVSNFFPHGESRKNES